VVGRLKRKSAAASDRPGSDQKQTSMNVVTVKFGEIQKEQMGIRSVLLWGLDFPVMSRRNAKRVSFLIWVVLGERLAVVGENCLQGAKGAIQRRQVLGGLT